MQTSQLRQNRKSFIFHLTNIHSLVRSVLPLRSTQTLLLAVFSNNFQNQRHVTECQCLPRKQHGMDLLFILISNVTFLLQGGSLSFTRRSTLRVEHKVCHCVHKQENISNQKVKEETFHFCSALIMVIKDKLAKFQDSFR